MLTLRESLILAMKDLHSEFRTKQMINSMLIFSMIVIIIFNFAFSELLAEPQGVDSDNDEFIDYLAAGVLWITFIFTGMLGLSRSFNSEKDKNCLEGLMLCPVSRNTIYVGKLISNLVLIFLIEIISLFIFSLFFSYDIFDKINLLIPIFILGTAGFVIVGALLSAISMNTRNREVLLPLLLFPILIPVLISAVVATTQVLTGASIYDIGNSLKLLAAYDIIFLVIALLTFEFVIEE